MQLKLTLTLILLLCLSNSWARKLVVTATDDNVSTPIEGMLRYHIINAVKDDTIVFDVTTVTLAGEISISSKSIVIDGGTGVTLDAQQSDRIFNITSYSASNKLEIKNLNLINGYKSGDLATGGAMRVHLSSGELIVENCVFENNTVESAGDGQGGALRANGGTFINCSFLNNQVIGSTSVLGGGGIFVYGSGQFINCVIAGNSAQYGGGINSGGNVEFSNCTITDNSTPEADKGGGISNDGSTYTNCIIWENTSGVATNNIRHYDGSYTNCAMEQGNALVTGSNIGLSASPFVSVTAPYDLSLIPTSECIDAGTDAGVTLTSYDIAGNARISGSTIDIGAYEFLFPRPHATLPYSEDFGTEWIDFDDMGDAPSEFWNMAPETGQVDLHVDFSTLTGDKALYFNYINSDGDDWIEISVSEDGGANFSPAIAAFNNAATWERKAIDLGNLTSETGVIRLSALPSDGHNLIGIDDVTVGSHTTTPIVADFSANRTSGIAPVTVMFTDNSTGDVISWEWDFDGDGTTDATAQNPIYTFTEAGTYTVELRASKPGISASKTLTIEVEPQEYATLPFHESFDNEWVSRNADRDVPGIHWNNTPASGNNSWSRIDDGVLRGAWASDDSKYRIHGANATPYSAAFNADISWDMSGSLDLSIDFSSLDGNKRLEFWYINANEHHSVEVELSVDGGKTFSQLCALTTTKLWERSIIDLGELMDTQGVIRFTGHGDGDGSLMMGIDEVRVFNPTILPLKADFTIDVTSGAAPLTVQFTDGSEGDIVSYEWDFDSDGIVDAIAASPSHEYTEPGVYSVTLTVHDANGSHTKTAERLIVVPGYASLPFLESFEETWVSRDWLRDVPSYYAKSAVPTDGWSRDDDFDARGVYRAIDYDYSEAAANGTAHAARIPMSFNEKALDFYLDFSTMEGEKILTFWSILPNSDKMYVSLSQDDGATFGEDLVVLENQSTWTKNRLNLGEINSPTCVLRFIVRTPGTGGQVSEPSGLDELGINAIEADFSADVSSGVAPLTVTFQDLSTFEPSAWEWDFDNDGVVDDITQNPEYTFTEPGDYTVVMRASNTFTTDRVVKTNYITVAASTGIEDNTYESIQLYPNPTKGVVHIEAPNGIIQRIEIVDIAGVLLDVIEPSRMNGKSFDVSLLPQGTVFVRIVCSDKTVTKKLIIKK